MPTTVELASARIAQFAAKHGVTFDDHGECGFGRPCVGLASLETGGWLDYNPDRYSYAPGAINPEITQIDELYDVRLYPPANVPDAYHKHACMAVLITGDDEDAGRERAILQLADWCDYLDDLGVDVVAYATGARGVHLLTKQAIGRSLRVTAPDATQAPVQGQEGI